MATVKDTKRKTLFEAAITAFEADAEGDEFISRHSVARRNEHLEGMKFALMEGDAADFDAQHAAFWNV